MAERAPDLPPWADAAFLRDVQYADDRNLAARQSIYAYCDRQADLPALVIDSLRLASDDAVVDVGCGNGLYLAELARRGHAGPVAGVDLSPGMLGAARAGGAAARGRRGAPAAARRGQRRHARHAHALSRPGTCGRGRRAAPRDPAGRQGRD